MKKCNFETVVFRDELYYGEEPDYPLIYEGRTDLATALTELDCNCVLECLYPKLFGFDKLVVSVLSASSCHVHADKLRFFEPKGWIVNGNPMRVSLMPMASSRVSKFGFVNELKGSDRGLECFLVSTFQLRLWRVREYSAPLSFRVNGMCNNDPLVLNNCDYTAELEFRAAMKPISLDDDIDIESSLSDEMPF